MALYRHDDGIHIQSLVYRFVLGSGGFLLGSHSPLQERLPAHSEDQEQTGSGMYGCKLAQRRRTLGSFHMSVL